MRVTFCCEDTRPDAWLQGLRTTLPGAEVDIWSPGAPQADYALVWAPPQRFIDEQPGLKALFNIGAGVDALLPLRLPPDLPVYRLEDAGMAVQMAEYVSQAVIRFFRGLDGYEADMAAGSGSTGPIPGVPTTPWASWDWAAWASARARWRCSISRQRLEPYAACHRRRAWLLRPAGLRRLSARHPHPRQPAAADPETDRIIDARSLALLQPGAYVINVGRGGHVADEDLVAAIDGAMCPARCSMCSAPSRCPTAMPSGGIRASRSRPTLRRAPWRATAWSRSWARSRR